MILVRITLNNLRSMTYAEEELQKWIDKCNEATKQIKEIMKNKTPEEREEIYNFFDRHEII